MANRGKRRKKTGKKTLASRRTRRGGRRTSRAPSRPQGTSSVGRMFATGVRNVISLLPGSSVLSPIADIILKTVGLATDVQEDRTRVSGTTSMYGLATKFAICPAHIMVASKVGWKSRPVDYTTVVHTEFREARIVEIEVSVEPANQISSRTGEWILSLYPFYDESDHDMFQADTSIPDRVLLHQAPFSTTGSASLPLALKFRPRVTDGFAFHFNKPTITRLGVVVRYEDYNRENYVDFKSDEFGVSLVLKGKVELRSAQANVKDNFYTGKINDLLATVGHQFTFGNKTYVIASSDFKCTPTKDGKSCKVSGTMLTSPDLCNEPWLSGISLGSMAME